MDEGDKGKLSEILEITEENHRMIRRLYKAYWWSKIGSIVYWLIIFGIVFGVFYYVQPYLGVLGDILAKIQDTVGAARGTADSVRDAF